MDLYEYDNEADLLGEDWYSEDEKANRQERERFKEVQLSYLD